MSTSYTERALSVIDQGIAQLEPWAEWTPIKTDDGILAVLKGIKHDAALLGYVAAKAEQADQGVLSLETHPTEQISMALSRSGIAWEIFQALLPILLKKIAMGS
jgi:hypothetical protein